MSKNKKENKKKMIVHMVIVVTQCATQNYCSTKMPDYMMSGKKWDLMIFIFIVLDLIDFTIRKNKAFFMSTFNTDGEK